MPGLNFPKSRHLDLTLIRCYTHRAFNDWLLPTVSSSPRPCCATMRYLWYTGHVSDTCVHLWGNSIRQPSKMDSLWLWHMIACLRNSLPLGLQECCRSVWVQMHMHTVSTFSEQILPGIMQGRCFWVLLQPLPCLISAEDTYASQRFRFVKVNMTEFDAR